MGIFSDIADKGAMDKAGKITGRLNQKSVATIKEIVALCKVSNSLFIASHILENLQLIHHPNVPAAILEIVKDKPQLSHEALQMLKGQPFDNARDIMVQIGSLNPYATTQVIDVLKETKDQGAAYYLHNLGMKINVAEDFENPASSIYQVVDAMLYIRATTGFNIIDPLADLGMCRPVTSYVIDRLREIGSDEAILAIGKISSGSPRLVQAHAAETLINLFHQANAPSDVLENTMNTAVAEIAIKSAHYSGDIGTLTKLRDVLARASGISQLRQTVRQQAEDGYDKITSLMAERLPQGGIDGVMP